MIITLVFCVCVTVLSCYTVHTVLADNVREQKNTEVSRVMAEIDLLSLKKPLKIEKKRLPEHIIHILKDTRRASIIDVEPIKTPKHALNFYPIIPSDKLSIGYGFDARV